MRPLRILLATALVTALALPFMDAAAGAAQPAPASTKAALPPPVQGTDYDLIDHPAPIHGRKVEVVEVFGYGCPICNRFQPFLSAWEKKAPADVSLSYLPAPFGADPEHCWDEFARAFFAAQALGVQAKAHEGIYKEVFEQHQLVSCESVSELWSDYGVSQKTLAARMQTFDVGAKMSAAHDQVVHWGVDGTPTLVVDGKYRVSLTRQGGPDGLLRTVDWLIAKQRPLHRGR